MLVKQQEERTLPECCCISAGRLVGRSVGFLPSCSLEISTFFSPYQSRTPRNMTPPLETLVSIIKLLGSLDRQRKFSELGTAELPSEEQAAGTPLSTGRNQASTISCTWVSYSYHPPPSRISTLLLSNAFHSTSQGVHNNLCFSLLLSCLV